MMKISRWERRMLIGFSLFFLILISNACSTTSTLLPAAIITANPTAIPSPTSTPDPFVGLKSCTTWRDAKENCVVSLEDLMSGKLVDYARTVTEPFPDDAFYLDIERHPGKVAANSFVFAGEAIGPVDDATRAMLDKTNGAGVRYNNEIFSDPRSPIGERLIFWIKGDGTSNFMYDVVAEVTKIKNKDGTDGYYTVIGLPVLLPGGSTEVDQVETERRYDVIFDNFYYQPPLYDGRYLTDTEEWVLHYENMKILLDILRDDGGVNKKMMDEWVSTDIIPKELETKPLISVFIDNYFGYGVPWAK